MTLRGWSRGAFPPGEALVAVLAGGLLLVAAWSARAGAPETAASMLRRVIGVPEATAGVVLERSDPFGGPPERERGRVWYIPGRGLRYRADGAQGHQVAADREADHVLLYRPSESKLYRAKWAKAPLRLRRFVVEPERILDNAAAAREETRDVRGRPRLGWRLRGGATGDSLSRVSAWMAGDPATGLPRYVLLAGDVDTLLVEFRDWSLRREARPADLSIRVPAGTPESPLDPRDLLNAGTQGTRAGKAVDAPARSRATVRFVATEGPAPLNAARRARRPS